MKTFYEILKVDLTRGAFRATVKNKDMIEFLKYQPNSHKCEEAVLEGLKHAGFSITDKINTYMSPANNETVYEQDRYCGVEENRRKNDR